MSPFAKIDKKNNLFYKDYTDTSLIYTPWSAHGGHDLG